MNSNKLAAAAHTATQIDLAQAEAAHTQAHGYSACLEIAAYQAAIREGRTYYFVQIPGGAFQAFADLDDAIKMAPHWAGATAPLTHKRFEPTGEIVDVASDGTEKAPRPRYLAGLAEDIANVDRIAKSLVRR